MAPARGPARPRPGHGRFSLGTYFNWFDPLGRFARGASALASALELSPASGPRGGRDGEQLEEKIGAARLEAFIGAPCAVVSPFCAPYNGVASPSPRSPPARWAADRAAAPCGLPTLRAPGDRGQGGRTGDRRWWLYRCYRCAIAVRPGGKAVRGSGTVRQALPFRVPVLDAAVPRGGAGPGPGAVFSR